MNATAALLAQANIAIRRVAGRGFVLTQNGIEIDAPQKTKRDALSVGVAYALGYVA